jgi:beta-glucosidase
MAGDVVRPLQELKAFKKVLLQPGESKEISFTLEEQQLRYYHADLTFASDPGEFELYIGPNSRDVSALKFKLSR